MKFSKVLVSSAALLCLVACNQQPAGVSEEKFAEAVAKIEKHEYATAHVEYSESLKYTFKGFTAEEEAAMREQGKMNDYSENEKVDFTFDGEEWITNAAVQHNAIVNYLGQNVKDIPIEGATEEGAKLYLNPFKIAISESESQGGQSASIKTVMVFDKYGFLTSFNYEMVMSSSVAQGKSLSMKGVMKFTAAYADAK